MAEQDTGSDFEAGGFGVKLGAKNIKDPNTLATFATLIIVVGIGIAGYFVHAQAQQEKSNTASTLVKSNTDIANALKDSNLAIVQTLKESNANTLSAIRDFTVEQRRMTEALNIANCLNDPTMKNRSDARDACNRITRGYR